MEEKLILTTRALGEAESLIEIHEERIAAQEELLALKTEEHQATKDYWEDYHKKYKKNAANKTMKKVIIAFIVGLTAGILIVGI